MTNTFLRDDATFASPLYFPRATVGDASYNIAVGDGLVATTAAFTSPRTFTLPAAASVTAGQIKFIVDEVGAVSSTDTLTIAVQSGDKLNGTLNATQVISNPNCALCFESDGAGNWQFAGQNLFPALFVNNNAVLTVAGNQTLSGGFSQTPFSLGTVSSGSITPSPLNNLKQTLVNGGSFTLNPPTVVGDIELYITNNGSAGTITPGAFTKQYTGDTLDTTNGHEFVIFLYTYKNDAGSVKTAYLIKAMQ